MSNRSDALRFVNKVIRPCFPPPYNPARLHAGFFHGVFVSLFAVSMDSFICSGVKTPGGLMLKVDTKMRAFCLA